MPRRDEPAIFDVSRIVIKHRLDQDDPDSSINGSLRLVFEGGEDPPGEDPPIEITVHNPHHHPPFRRTGTIEIVNQLEDQTSDHEALLAIQEILDGVEWNSNTLERIAEIMTSAGYHIGELEEGGDDPTRRMYREAFKE